MIAFLAAIAVATPAPRPVDGFAGTALYTPAGTPTAALVVLHGSEGGRAPNAPWVAAWLADQGFVTAAFCWFGCDGLPRAVDRVSLDRTVQFLQWLHDEPAKGLPIVVYGASRGAEQALLLGSLLAEDDLVAGIAAHAGTDTVVAAYDPQTRGTLSIVDGYDAAWTWHGEPLYGERALPYGSGPRIAIERYPGPVWLSHGGADPLWPADRSRRLKEARGALPTELHVWEGDGHVLGPRNGPAMLASLAAFVRTVAR